MSKVEIFWPIKGKQLAQEIAEEINRSFIEAMGIPKGYLNPDKPCQMICVDDPEYDPFPDAEKAEFEVIDDDE